jgi:nitrogen regulatory protein PII
MKKVEAVFESFKLDQVREALAKENIPRITIFEVKGGGCHQGQLKAYRGVRYVEASIEIKIELVLDDDDAERIAQLIVDTLQTGNLGDGEVSIISHRANLPSTDRPTRASSTRLGNRGCRALSEPSFD